MKAKLVILLIVPIIWASQQKPESKLNEIRVIGSHNSYKIAIEPAIWKIINLFDSDQAHSLEYGHISLTDQLDLGLRNLEIDVFHDPIGGRFADPLGRRILNAIGVESPSFDQDSVLNTPGLKVFHVQDIDFRSHHLLFSDALQALKKWSIKNPKHVPIFITLEAKDKKISGLKDPLPITTEVLDSIDMELLKWLGKDKLITPDLVRGDAKSVNDQVTSTGWPILSNMRGKFLFVLDDKRKKRDLYVLGHSGLQNRVMFTNSEAGTPESAFMIINNPIKNQEAIQQMVQKGYIVRTRSDASTVEARNNDYTRFQAAVSSNAQVITTDYYLPSKLFPSSYKVKFEGGGYVMMP